MLLEYLDAFRVIHEVQKRWFDEIKALSSEFIVLFFLVFAILTGFLCDF